eukprot:8582818-Ditylum_brightwellii.AAC.1
MRECLSSTPLDTSNCKYHRAAVASALISKSSDGSALVNSHASTCKGRGALHSPPPPFLHSPPPPSPHSIPLPPPPSPHSPPSSSLPPSLPHMAPCK